jgi:hypothetical protein
LEQRNNQQSGEFFYKLKKKASIDRKYMMEHKIDEKRMTRWIIEFIGWVTVIVGFSIAIASV